jgi:transposase
MDEINKIKKAYRDGASINEIAIKYSRSWLTVKRMVDLSLEELENRGRRPNKKCKVVTSEVEAAIRAYLIKEEQLRVKKKQQYTATFIYKELKANGTYKGSIRQLQDAVKRLRLERGQVKPKSYLPLEFPLGSTIQFDHGECDLVISGRRVEGYLFVSSIPGAVLRYCQVFPIKGTEAWGEFHERTYRFFGGVLPISIYDNDSVLVKQILGNEREQTRFSHALEEHYQMSSRFCNPAAGNEKGSVENGVGYCRRNYLAGCPSFASWDAANKHLEQSCRRTINTDHHYQTDRPLRAIFDAMMNELNPLFVTHTWRRWVEAHVDSYQLVWVDRHGYSVPERFVGSNLRVGLGVFDVEVFNNHAVVARHSRRFGETGSSLCLDHYLDQLARKPGALWDCQAIQQHAFSSELLEIWQRLQRRYSEANANRKFIKVLCLGRHYGSENLSLAAREALSLRLVEPEALESIIYSFLSARPNGSEECFRQRFQNVKFDSWSCDVDQYSQLVGGGSL